MLSASGRAADGVSIAGLPSPPLPALAVPEKWRGLLIPGLCGLLEPGPDLLRALRVLAVERASLEDALDGFGPVQPATTERCVERHDPVPTEPDDHLGRLVTGEVVPHEAHAQRRQFGRQCEAFCQPALPSFPRAAGHGCIGRLGLHRQSCHNRGQPRLEPTRQDRVGAAADRLEVHLSGCGMEQGQDLARATPDRLVRPDCRVTLRPPTAARLR